MRHPVKKVYITQPWGVNKKTYQRFGLLGHNGVDYRTFDENGNWASTCKVYAPHSGEVLEALNDKNGYGLYLKLENSKFGSILGHNKRLLVKKGDKVKEGQLVAIGDNTGWSTGPHVHWGLYPKPRNRGNGYSGTVDPTPYLKNNEGDNMTDKKYEEIIGKASQRDKVVNERGYNLGTADDKELLEAIEKDIKENYVEKTEVDDKVKEETKDLNKEYKKCDLARSEMGEKVKDARERIQSLEEELSSEKASKAQFKGQVDRLKEELEDCQSKPAGDTKSTEAKMFKLILYLSISGGVGYVLSNYVAQDPELFKIITPITNLVLYYLEQQVKVLKGDLGLKKIDK
jgi:hypothetical protein